jgi:transglutaminase/protease-like cytokinesis protein 3
MERKFDDDIEITAQTKVKVDAQFDIGENKPREIKRAKGDAKVAAVEDESTKEIEAESTEASAVDARAKEDTKEAKQTIKRTRDNAANIESVKEAGEEAAKEAKRTIKRDRTEAVEVAKEVEAESNDADSVAAQLEKNAALVKLLSCGSKGCGCGVNGTFVCTSNAKMKLHERTDKHQVCETSEIRAKLEIRALMSVFVLQSE